MNDFLLIMQHHLTTCKMCTDLTFCTEALGILNREFPDMLVLPGPNELR